MYKKRQKLYKKLQNKSKEEIFISSDEEDAVTSVSDAAKRSASSVDNSMDDHVSIDDGDSVTDEGSIGDGDEDANISTTASIKKKESDYKPRLRTAETRARKPIEIAERPAVINRAGRDMNSIKRVKFDQDTERRIPKREEWQLLSDTVRKQMRQLLSDDYRKTLSNIAGSAAFGALSKEGQRHGENLLLPIASDIDKDLKLTLIPGKVDTKLLDPELPILYHKLNTQVEANYRKLAKFAVMVNEREAGLAPLKKEVVKLKEQYEATKEIYDTRIATEENPNDYVQMLLLHPSSEQY